MKGGVLPLLLILLATSTADEETKPKKKEAMITFYDPATFKQLGTEDAKKASFFESRFAYAEYEPKCHDGDKFTIIPIYYTSGGTVELPCKMCEMAHVINGIPKQWRYIPLHHATRFLANPREFMLKHGGDTTGAYVQSLTYSMTPAGGGFHRRDRFLRRLRKDDIQPAPFIDSIHRYIQSDGKLYIRGTILETSGIYFCADRISLAADTKIFFMLIAMAPLVYVELHVGSKADMISPWNVAPWLTSKQPYEPDCYADSNTFTMPDEYAHMRYGPADFELLNEKNRLLPRPLTTTVGGASKDAVQLNLLVDFEYSDWTPCKANGRSRFREVHCVLKRANDSTVPDLPYDQLQWAVALNTYFDHFPTLRLHSYLPTSLMYKGSSYGTHEGVADPETCDQRATKIRENFYTVFFSSLIGKSLAEYITATDPEKRDSGADHSCFDLDYRSPGEWYIRGVYYIEKQPCPT